MRNQNTKQSKQNKQIYSDFLNDNKINPQGFKNFIEILKDQYTEVIDFSTMTKEEIKIVVEQTLPNLLDNSLQVINFS